MIYVYGNSSLLPLNIREIGSSIKIMLAAFAPDSDVEVLCLNDAQIMALTRQHLHCPGPTNILSFPGDGQKFLGSLTLSVNCILREIMLYGQRPKDYCLALLAHGLAHLLGFEHGKDMEKTCKAMLEALPQTG